VAHFINNNEIIESSGTLNFATPVDADDGAPVLPAVPMGARRLASCVRSTHPALDRLLTRLLAPFVLVDDGWAAALDIGLAAPDVVAVTRDGDRFGGPTPWRAGPPGTSAVTPAALSCRSFRRVGLEGPPRGPPASRRSSVGRFISRPDDSRTGPRSPSLMRRQVVGTSRQA
jgi:hypothetical protein